MKEKIATLDADFRQLKTELGAFGVNLTPGAKASLGAVEEKLAELLLVSEVPSFLDFHDVHHVGEALVPPKPKAKLVGG